MNPQDSTPEPKEDGQQPSPQESADQQSSQSTPPESDLQPEGGDSGAPSQATPSSDDNSDGNNEDDLGKWATSQGIDLQNPTPEQMRKVAQRLRDTQNWAHNKNQNNQQFDKVQSDISEASDEGEDDTKRELREIRAQNARRDFWDSNPDDRHLEAKMIEYVGKLMDNYKKTANKSLLMGAQYYSTPEGWADLLNKVKSENIDSISDESFEAGAQAERQNLAKQQQAGSPKSNAVSSAPSKADTTDEQIGKMSLAEYNEWRKANNPFRP